MSLPQDFLIYHSEWDYLIILDACRYDYFELLHERYLHGTLIKAVSRANRTKDWFIETFRKFIPAIYYTANPVINAELCKDKFLDVRLVWEDNWDEKIESVSPFAVNEVVEREQPKKAIIHLLQPHFSSANFPLKTFNLYIKTIYEEHISIDELKSEYEKNLELGLEGVKELVQELDKKVVVTADHGEMLGASQLFFHEYSPRLFHPFLREVPWFEVHT